MTDYNFYFLFKWLILFPVLPVCVLCRLGVLLSVCVLFKLLFLDKF